jgi:hypothetical protein
MTDRIHSLTVVLSHDIRDDDIQPLITAIRLLKTVISVEAHVSDDVSYMAEERARRELRDKMHDILYPKHPMLHYE